MSIGSYGSSLGWAARIIGIGAFPLAVLTLVLALHGSARATTWCGVTGDDGGTYPYTWEQTLNRYADMSSCTGTREQEYELWAHPYVTTLDEIYDEYFRVWKCGTLYEGHYDGISYNVGTSGVSDAIGYTPANNCGWQADSNAEFVESGVMDEWSYVNF